MRIRRAAALLALVLVAVPVAVVWNEHQLDRESHALHMLLSRARAHAMQAEPVTVRFSGYRAVAENGRGEAIDSVWLTTLNEVRYRTTKGEGILVFGPGGATSHYNIHLHGGDITLRSWTGNSRSIWVHCTGGITEGRNDDWTLNGRSGP